MATNGIIYGARGGNAYGPRLELHWSVVSQDIAKNTTKIKVISIFNVNAAISYSSSKGKQGSTTVGGTTQTYTAPAPSSASQRTRTLGTTYHTITHASNGTYTGTLSGTFNLGSLAWAGTTLTTISASGSITLNTITRGINESSVTLATGWSDTTSSKTITYTAYSTSATVKVWWRYWNAKGGAWSSWYTISTDYTSGGAITLNETPVNNMHINNPASKTVNIEVKVAHYQGTALVGSVTKKTSLNLKVEAPDISLTVACTGRSIANLKSDKRGVQNVHYMNASATGTAKNGATIKRYQITFQGRTYSSSALKSLITQTGTLEVKAQIWDSRGFTRITSATIYSYAYTPPKLSGLVARRYTGSTIDPVGTSYKVTANISYTQMTADGEQACWPRWKFGSESYTYSTSILKSGTLAIEKSLQFTLYYGDSYSADKKYIVTIPTGQATFVLGKTSVGIGMVPPAGKAGLYLKNNLINGNKAITAVSIDADYTEVGSSNYIEAIKANWATLPEGISLVDIKVGSRGTAVFYKYTGGEYGYLIIFGYNNAGIQKWSYNQGTWYLQDDIDGTVYDTGSFTTIGDGIGASYTKLRRRGRNIYLRIDVDYTKINNYTSSNLITVTTINSVYRPPELTAGMVMYDSSQDVGKASCFISSDGAIRVVRAVGAIFDTNLKLNFVYPI